MHASDRRSIHVYAGALVALLAFVEAEPAFAQARDVREERGVF